MLLAELSDYAFLLMFGGILLVFIIGCAVLRPKPQPPAVGEDTEDRVDLFEEEENLGNGDPWTKWCRERKDED